MSKEVQFRLEATIDQIHGKTEGGITIETQGSPVELMQVLYSAMVGDNKVAGLIMGANKLYELKKLNGGNTVDTCPAFLAVMRRDEGYCKAITQAVVVFWSGAGVDMGQLPQLVKMG